MVIDHYYPSRKPYRPNTLKGIINAEGAARSGAVAQSAKECTPNHAQHEFIKTKHIHDGNENTIHLLKLACCHRCDAPDDDASSAWLPASTNTVTAAVAPSDGNDATRTPLLSTDSCIAAGALAAGVVNAGTPGNYKKMSK